MAKHKNHWLPDEIFQNKFNQFEFDADDFAWKKMESLLEEEDKRARGFVFWINENILKQKRTITYTMIGSILISGALWLSFKSSQEFDLNNHSRPKDNSIFESKQNGLLPNTAKKNLVSTPQSFNTVNVNTDAEQYPAAKPVLQANNFQQNQVNQNTVFNFKSLQIANKPWSLQNKYNFTDLGSDNLFSISALSQYSLKNNPPADLGVKSSKNSQHHGFAWQRNHVGLYFTIQNHENMKSVIGSTQSFGFNFKLMSSNHLKNTNNIGWYHGLDWGMQFYDRGERTNVILNTTNGDSAWTRLGMHHNDFFLRGHFEISYGRVVPYLTYFGGPRIYSTNQKVKSYLPLKEQESSDIHNVGRAAGLVGGIGLGTRIAFSKNVSLDFHAEAGRGTEVNLVNVNTSQFVNLNYRVQKQRVGVDYYQFKFGFLFSFEESEEDEEEYTPYNNRYPQQNTAPVFIYDSVTKTYKACTPCPCQCDSTYRQRQNNYRSEPADEIYKNGSGNNAGNLESSASSKRKKRRSLNSDGGGCSGWDFGDLGGLGTGSSGGSGGFPGIGGGGGVRR